MKFYPYKKGRQKKILAMLKGGTNSFEVVLIRELEVLAIVKNIKKGAKSVTLF